MAALKQNTNFTWTAAKSGDKKPTEFKYQNYTKDILASGFVEEVWDKQRCTR